MVVLWAFRSVVQRRPPSWGDRPQDAEFVAESRWRIPPATVTEGRKLYLPVLQGRGADHLTRGLWPQLDERQGSQQTRSYRFINCNAIRPGSECSASAKAYPSHEKRS